MAIFSIIIPTFNRAKKVARAIESVLCQNFKDWEIILVDNNSSDETDQVIRDFNDPRIRLYKIHNDGIVAKSRNRGIYLAKGKFIAFLDSDDTFDPGKLDYIYEVFNDSKCDLIYHDLRIKYTEKKYRFFYRSKMKIRPIYDNSYEDLLIFGNAIVTSGVVLKKSVLQSGILFDESYSIIGAEDFDLWVQLAKNGSRFRYLNRTLGTYELGTHNYSDPKKTLQFCSYFKEKYRDEIKRLKRDKPFWISRSILLSYYRLRDWEGLALESRKEYYETSTLKSKFLLLGVFAVASAFKISDGIKGIAKKCFLRKSKNN